MELYTNFIEKVLSLKRFNSHLIINESKREIYREH